MFYILQIPSTEEKWKDVAGVFEKKWNFGNCIGVMDGKRVAIRKPPYSESMYYNYKGTFSIVLLDLVNAVYEFMMVDVGANGRITDGGVLYYTEFWEKM